MLPWVESVSVAASYQEFQRQEFPEDEPEETDEGPR